MYAWLVRAVVEGRGAHSEGNVRFVLEATSESERSQNDVVIEPTIIFFTHLLRASCKEATKSGAHEHIVQAARGVIDRVLDKSKRAAGSAGSGAAAIDASRPQSSSTLLAHLFDSIATEQATAASNVVQYRTLPLLLQYITCVFAAIPPVCCMLSLLVCLFARCRSSLADAFVRLYRALVEKQQSATAAAAASASAAAAAAATDAAAAADAAAAVDAASLNASDDVRKEETAQEKEVQKSRLRNRIARLVLFGLLRLMDGKANANALQATFMELERKKTVFILLRLCRGNFQLH